MLIKIFVVLLLIVIIGSLSSGLFFLVSDKGHSDRAVKALTWRIALSLAAFALLMMGSWAGFIQPHGVF
ncbi:MAG: twin transmembrane helix small protein [Gammaproteobacteria bacterium]|nr:twin transmembrane helix small protein [Gammaproteobacteria bacterium]